jgi:hypothetical protein
MSSKNENMTEEDYLNKHLGDLESNKNKVYESESESDNSNIHANSGVRVDDLQYFSYDVKDLPCGRFYPAGSVFMVRPARVKEIQAYSMVDDNNFYDVVEKMNYILQSCVRIKYSGGKMGSYLDIKDQDRLFLIFLIRELTFQSGNTLSVNTKCVCGEDIQLELKRGNFKFHEIDEKLEKFFDSHKGSYNFKTIGGSSFEITPPNIGIQKAFTEYIIKESNDKVSPNLSFLKIIPFMLGSRTSITYDGIKSKLVEFESMSDISFQFLNAAVGKMTFGIKELQKKCVCNEEVTAEMQFPNGASGIFVVHDAFEAYLEK